MFGKLRLGYFAIFFVAALMLSAAAAVGDRSLPAYFGFSSWKRMIGIWLMPAFVWIAWLGILVTYRHVDRPTIAIARIIRRHRHWLMRGLLFCFLLWPLASAFSVVKQSIPELVPFYADPALAYADRLLFFGTDPWEVTHSLLGPFGTMLLDRLYLTWFLLMMVLLAWLCFTRNQRLQVRGLLSYVLCWAILGNLLALSASSVGPCFYKLFYHDGRFDALMQTLQANDARYSLASFRTMDWLYNNSEVENLGGGISAMPSMHISISFLLFLVINSELKMRIIGIFAAFYTFAMWVGSIHLAWHYAVDGLVSVIGVAAIWWATGRFVAWLDRQGEASSARDPEAGALVGTLPQTEAA